MRHLLAVWLLCALAACGDDSSSADASLGKDAGAVDAQGIDSSPADSGPFAVVAVTPSPGAIGVPLSSQIVATLSRDIDVSSVGASSFSVHRELLTMPVDGLLGVRGTQVSWTPTQALLGCQTYDLQLLPISSADGERLAAPYSWAFRTGPSTAPGALVSDQSSRSFGPVLARLPNDGALAAWVQPEGSGYVVRTAVAGAGGWGTPTTLSTDAEFGGRIRAASDSAGDVFVVWTKSPKLWGARRSAAGTWSAPVEVGGVFSSDAFGLAVTPAGDAAVITGESNIYVQRYSGGTWLPRETIFTQTRQSQGPQIVAAPGGELYAFWDGNPNAPFDDFIMSARYLPGSGWTAPQALSISTGGTHAITAAASAAGAIVFWQEHGGMSTGQLASARYLPATGWGAQRVVGPLTSTADALRASMNDAGVALLAYVGAYHLGLVRDDGAGTTTTIDQPGSVWTTLALERSGPDFVVGYTAQDFYGRYSPFIVTIPAVGAALPVVPLSGRCGTAGTIALAPGQPVRVAWLETLTMGSSAHDYVYSDR